MDGSDRAERLDDHKLIDAKIVTRYLFGYCGPGENDDEYGA